MAWVVVVVVWGATPGCRSLCRTPSPSDHLAPVCDGDTRHMALCHISASVRRGHALWGAAREQPIDAENGK